MGLPGLRRIAVLVYPHVDLLDVAGPSEVFAATRQALAAVGGTRESGYASRDPRCLAGACCRDGQWGQAACRPQLPRSSWPDRYAARGGRTGIRRGGEGSSTALLAEPDGASGPPRWLDLHRRSSSWRQRGCSTAPGDDPLEILSSPGDCLSAHEG